ncbi:MAG: hypothetical protein JWP88_1570 [Flaviaesturariibacter sp.]|nr:hypothetical protein [Flaviaesturariibacter sp.]
MAENKTKATNASVAGYINNLPQEEKRKDSLAILEMMRKASGEEPKLWGDSLIGFGEVKITSPTSGRVVDWFRVGFAPRKANFSIYISGNINKQYAEALTKLGKHKTGLGCLYINKLADVDVDILRSMIEESLTKPFSSV